MEYHFITGTLKIDFLIFSLFILAEMALEQTVRDLQAQNAQFHVMFTSLVQGQEDMKKLINRKKRIVGVLNMGRRYKGGPKVVSQIELSESVKTEGSIKGNEEDQREPEKEEDHYENDHYSDEDDKFKQLEDRLNAVESLKM